MNTDDVVGPRLRAVISAMPRYVPGRPAAETAYKISSKETPYPPLRSVLEAVADAARTLNRYPDMASLRLVHAIAHRLRVPGPPLRPPPGRGAGRGHPR